LTLTDESIQLDFSKVDSLPPPPARQELTLKVRSPRILTFNSDTIKVASEAPAEMEGTYQYILRLSRMPGKKDAQLNYAPRS
jgi:hypothetical protein